MTTATDKRKHPRKPALPPAMLVQFVCTRFAAKLTLGSCAAMHKRANSGEARGNGMDAMLKANFGRCRKCEIGQHHRAQKAPHPEVELVQIDAKPSGLAKSVRQNGRAQLLPSRGRRSKATGGW